MGKTNESCAHFPEIYDLKFNKYWQVMESSNGTYYLYAAYLDARELNLLGPTIRILAMVNRLEPWYLDTYCQLWFNQSSAPILTKVTSIYLIWEKSWGYYGPYQPFLLSCNLPETHEKKIPSSLSLVENPCEKATNNIKVTYEESKHSHKLRFGVCVKFLHGPQTDISARIAEWIETLYALGADKIFLYNL